MTAVMTMTICVDPGDTNTTAADDTSTTAADDISTTATNDTSTTAADDTFPREPTPSPGKCQPLCCLDRRYRNCLDLQTTGGVAVSGVYIVYPYNTSPERPVNVWCDMTTDGGGWTVIQRRDDYPLQENFYRRWIEYALGFGDLQREHWLGLDHIHALTDQTVYELRVDLADFSGNRRSAKYSLFYVHNRDAFYLLEVDGYSGTAGDSLSPHNGRKFSARDKDLDGYGAASCAQRYSGAWWYAACHASNLNGKYLAGNHTSYADGVNWRTWLGYHYSLKKTVMMIRPVRPSRVPSTPSSQPTSTT
ncbi:Fibrinogen C domain-containing protein 1-like 3 [Homarus americanus]|uniref:Fibrinogen C domain-containing protein 1-like 3 n=2 Tax=Homarus americanus TaxID=6706 RepID=A0A8J5K447_HOMAM|nr:Fibrinogen C domain-containing protein 1-like 3 [Homarus americanus]